MIEMAFICRNGNFSRTAIANNGITGNQTANVSNTAVEVIHVGVYGDVTVVCPEIAEVDNASASICVNVKNSDICQLALRKLVSPPFEPIEPTVRWSLVIELSPPPRTENLMTFSRLRSLSPRCPRRDSWFHLQHPNQ